MTILEAVEKIIELKGLEIFKISFIVFLFVLLWEVIFEPLPHLLHT